MKVEDYNDRKAALEKLDKNYKAKWLDLIFAILQLFRQEGSYVFKTRFRMYLLKGLDDQKDLKKNFDDFVNGFKDENAKKKLEAYNKVNIVFSDLGLRK